MPLNRAYSILHIREVGSLDGERIITGTATTPSPDRMGDIVEPLGVRFKNPLPLLWQHSSDKPVGTVRFSKPTKEGIEFEARIVKVDEPGTLKDRVDEAWQSVKAGLVRAVSIGFQALEYSIIEATGGLRFTETEVLELSLVTIPANAEATITTIKSIDSAIRAAFGQRRMDTPPRSAPTHRMEKGKAMPKSLAERLAAFEDTMAAKKAKMVEIMDAAEEDGARTLTAEERDAYDELSAEVKDLREHIARTKSLMEVSAAAASPVGDVRSAAAAAATRGQDAPTTAAGTPARVKPPKEAPGTSFARFARCMILAKKTGTPAMAIAQQEYGERDPEVVKMVTKANVSAINQTTDAALIGNEGGVADYVEFLRNQTIVGKFGQNGIPALRRVPFYYPVVTQATGGTAYWVAEGAAKPMTKPTWSRTELTPLTVAGLAAITLQALRFSSPAADIALRDDLTAAIVEAIDSAFIDAANAGSAGAKPASISNGVTPVGSIGNDADSVRTDARLAMKKFVAAKNPLTTGVWIMSGSVALGLASMVNALGQPEFPGVSANGGTFMALPVIVSEAAGNVVTLVNASDIWLADDGPVNVDMSDSASLQMVTDPTGTSTGSDPVEATMVSMFQTNSIAVRVEKMINWARRRPTAVAIITSADWGEDAAVTT